MERREEVYKALHTENVKLILSEIDTGLIKENQVKQIALAMKNRVHGVFEEKRHIEKHSLHDTMLFMLDSWWESFLYRPDINGCECLVEILEELGLGHLAHQMKTNIQQV
jgi:hypothetical protein